MEGQPALTGRIDPPPDAGAESVLCPPLSILDESLFGSESLDRMVSGCFDGNISEDDAGCYFASEEPVTGLFEEDVPISCQDVADFCQALPSTTASCSPQKEFIPQQSLHFFCDRENYSGNHFVASETVSLHVDASDVTGCGLVYSCTTSHPCDPVNVEGNCESNSCYPATRRRNPKRAASLKSSVSIAKTGLKVGKKHVKTSKKVVGGLSNVIWESLKKATRKRSFRNHIHSSVWGAFDKLYKLFEQDDGGLFQNAHIISSKKCSRRAASYSRGKRSESKSKKVAKNSRKKAASTTNLMCSEDSSSRLPELVGSALFERDVADNCMANNKDHLDIACNQFDFLESSITSSERDIQHIDKEPDSSVTEEVFGENNSTDMPGVSSQTIPHSLDDSSEDVIPIYPSTSPESDVIHPTADAGTIASDRVTSTDQEPPLSVGFVSKNDNAMDSGTISSLIFQQTTGLNMDNILMEDKSGMSSKSGTYLVGEMPDCYASFHKPGKVATCSDFGLQREEDLNSLKKYNRKVGKKLNKKFSNQELQLGKLSGETVNLSGFPESSQRKNGKHRCLLPFADGRTKDVEVGKSNGKTPSCIESAERQNLGRRSKSDKGFTSKHKDKRKVVKEMSACVAFSGKEDELASTDCLGMHTACLLNAVEESTKYHGMQNACVLSTTTELTKTSVDGSNLPGFNRSSAENIVGSEAIYINDKSETHNFVGQDSETICSQERAWVCCDDCSKWRCISEKLADIIDETKCRWTCMDNDDKMFADCSIPQEKSNSEINAELGIPDEEVVCDMQQNITFPDSSNLDANKRAPWVSIRSNMFLHRSRKKQTIDEIMVCHCKPPLDGSMGCTDDCLNRMLNIECVRGTCPCGDLCSNQQFQKRKYTKMKWFRSGNKGFGLKLQEKVSEGDFLIEYVGEVLDMATYEARQMEYAYRGQEHFYFMTLNSHEVIDACNKGNLGRFINHSCEPNCRTEKWMVKGEVCIGLFALRDIKKGEEITFDYNYVRVVGAAAKKCFCESAQCRGFIGSDPLNSEYIGHDDSDEEYPGPIKICNDGAEFALNERVSDTVDISDESQKDSDRKLNSQDAEEAIGVSGQQHGKFSVCAKNIKIDNSESEDLVSTEETARESVFNNQPSEISRGMNTVSESLSEASLENKITAPADTSQHRMDKPRTSSKLPHLGGNKNSCSFKPLFQKSKKINGDGCRPQFEGVEDKLNTLLDSDGGISKRKDCTKGYLKLLVVTAASNNAENEAIQSTRDLSLIIDALLKTKSRTVLTDIINKNGLQMLHNIMKQNRKNNIKIPILRKLLKVIEFLAAKGILTVEQINMDPTCVGVESFRDSIISLMYHSDIQVHQIARSFRDRWIPRTYKRASQVQRDRCLFDSHNENAGPLLPCKRQVDLIVGNGDTHNATSQRICISSADTERHSSADMCITSQKSSDFVDEAGCTLVNVTKIRKRKSRWDQDKPPDKIRRASMASAALEDASTKADSFQIADANSQTGKEATSSNPFQQDGDDEVPPGFDSPPGFSLHYKSENHVVAVNISTNCGDVVIGQVQERFLSQLPVSHGIPLALMQQLGTPANGSNQYFENWTVAPGMPFHPFPPLPPYPRKELNDVPGPSSSSCSVSHHLIASSVTERSRLTGQFISSSQCGPSVPCISNEMLASVSMMGMGDPHNSERWCRPSSGRCSFRPERSNNRGYHRFEPPWSRHRMSRQFKGNMRCGMQGRTLENSRKKVGDACDPNGVKGEEVGSTYHQQPKDS